MLGRPWRIAALATVTFVLGAGLGYVIGRPNRTPPFRPEPTTARVRVPDIRDLSVQDAQTVLVAFGLGLGLVGLRRSIDTPAGIVLEQDPGHGATAASGTTVDLVSSSGPGPEPGALYDFARGVLLPITRTGQLTWTSDAIALKDRAVSLGANTRVIGEAEVSPYRIAPASGPATGETVTVDVGAFRAPAFYVIERAFTRQRESLVRHHALEVRPESGSVSEPLTLVGHLCQPNRRTPSVTVEAVVSRGDRENVARLALPFPGSAYAFEMHVKLAGLEEAARVIRLRAGDRVVFETSGGVCRSNAFVVR